MRALFQNPKIALAYAAMILLAVALFIGTDDSPGSLDQTASNFSGAAKAGDNPHTFGETAPGKKPVRGEQKREEVVEFVPDDELVDDAQGFDPTPTDDFSGYNADPNERGYLSDQDKKKPAEDNGGWGSSTEG